MHGILSASVFFSVVLKKGTHVEFLLTERLDLVVNVQLLYVLSVSHLHTFDLARSLELLATTQLFDDARLIEFTFEFLNRSLDVLAFLYRYDDHCNTPPFSRSPNGA